VSLAGTATLELIMKPSEVFGVVVRGIGLCLVLCGLYWLLNGAMDTVYFTLSSLGVIEQQDTYAVSYFVDGIPTTLLGIFLLRKAGLIVRFAYPESPPHTDQVH
jgi:hypothetical protein